MTIIEVMLASTLSMLVFMSLLETVAIGRRLASDAKYRLAADAIAFDTAWGLFNQYATPQSFSDRWPKPTNGWVEVTADQAPDWHGRAKAYTYWEITPVGLPSSNWVIRTNVRWPLGGTKFATNTNYVIERYWVSRKLFLDTD
jgi:hypothetical protein